MQPSRSWTLLALVAVALLVACGRKATEADCQIIVDQTVAVKLKEKNVTDPAAVTKMQEELRSEVKGDVMDGCVGKRISDSALACIKSAQTQEEIVKCLR
ncbi:MAG TPA: hypothetical protein VF316_03010 [Polyangiaceae bacterium]